MVELVMSFSTIIVTFIMGLLVKKNEILESKYIPIQNAFIGILAGLICFALQYNTNLILSILTCFGSAMSAGGIYDLTRTRGDKREGD